MHRHPLRRLFAILFAVAFFNAAMLQVMPAAAAPMGGNMTMAAHDANPDSVPMPCRGMAPACMTDLGCIFMVGVPIPASQVDLRMTSFPVTYHWPTAMIADGRIRAPDLRPPIRLI